MSEGAPEGGHGHSHAGGAKLDLSHKIGPLSMGQWLLALGGVVGITWYLRKRSTAAATAAVTDPTASTATQQGIGNLAGATGSSGNGIDQTSGPASNESWLSHAEAALIGSGADAYTVDQTLLAYLAGEQLNSVQQSLFNRAVGLVGPVPLPVVAIPGTGTAANGSTTPPPASQPTTGTQGVAGGVGGASGGLVGSGGLLGAPIIYTPPSTPSSQQASVPPSSAIGPAPISAPPPVTYSQVANPAALKALPSGTALFTKINGVETYLTPAAYKALPSGTAIYTKN